MTKSVTAALVLSLVDEGLIDLDAAVSTYLPDVKGTSAYTVRQLLGQRTGLVAYQTTDAFAQMGGFGDPTRRWSPRELVALVEDLPPAFEAGSAFAYSNTNFILAGMIAEARARVPVEQALRERILGPADMKRSWLDGAEQVPEELAHGYSVRFDGQGRLLSAPGSLTDTTFALNETVAWTTGALVSTADQMASFYERLLSSQLVSATSTLAMTTSPEPPGASPAYGLGLWRYGSATRVGWGHSGDTAGYRSFGIGAPDGSVVIVVLCNDDHDEDAPRMIAEALGAAVVQ